MRYDHPDISREICLPNDLEWVWGRDGYGHATYDGIKLTAIRISAQDAAVHARYRNTTFRIKNLSFMRCIAMCMFISVTRLVNGQRR